MTAKCASLRRLILVSKSGMKLWYNCIRASPAWKTMRNKKLWVGWVWVLGVEGKKKEKEIKKLTTSADDTVPTLAPTEWAEAGVRTSPSVPISVRCSHRIEKSETETVAEPNRYQVLSFWFYLLIYLFMKLIKRRRMVWVLLKKKKKQSGAFYARFSDSQGFKFILFSQNRLTLSRSRLSLELSPSPDAAPRLCSHRRLTQRLACDLTVAWRSAASPELSPSLTSHGKTTVSFFVFSVLFVFVCFPFHLFGKAESLND